MPDAPPPPEIVVDRVDLGGSWTRVTHVAGGAGRAFVLVAGVGVGVASTYFEFLAPALAERGDVYALDLPGFGGVPRPHDQPTIEFFADHVEHVLDRYGLDDPVIIGHSMGTQIVTEVLVRRPELSHGVLISPVINDLEPSPPVVAIRFAESAAHETLHVALTALTAYVFCGVVYFATVLPHLLRYPTSEKVRGIRASTLLIRGELDRTSPRRFHARLLARMRDARTWEIRGTAHSVLNAHAPGVAALVVRHVDGALARRGRLDEAEARTPEPPHLTLELALDAIRSRAAGWAAAVRGDDRGVQHAKTAHARTLWRAYFRS